MKKLFLILILFHCNPSFSQCALIDIKLTECVSCYQNLAYLDTHYASIPVFAVFGKSSEEDSADIDYKLKLARYGITSIYNDELHSKLSKIDNTSAITLVDVNGDWVWTKPIKEMTKPFIKDSLDIKSPNASFDNDYAYKEHGGYRYKFNYNTGVLKVTDRKTNQKKFEIKPSGFDYNNLEKNLTDEERFYFKQVNNEINKESNITPVYTWFNVDDDENIYLIFRYSNITMQGKENATVIDKYCVTKYDKNGKLLTINPIQEQVKGSNRNFNVYTGRFCLVDSGTILCFAHDYKYWFDDIIKLKPDSIIYFANEYKLQNGRYYHTRSYPIDLPFIHRTKYFENYLSEELSSYPVIGVQFGNDLYNVENGAVTHLVNDEEYRKSIRVKKEVDGNEQLFVYGVLADKERKNVFVIFKWGSSVYVNHYNLKLELQKSFLLNSLFPKANISSADFDKTKSLLHINDLTTRRRWALPLGLL